MVHVHFFYKNLNIFIKSMQSKFPDPVPIILGGDWNTVLDDNIPELNIDIYENKSVPKACNNKKLLELMNMHQLVDPFRVMYPDVSDFTYAPFGVLRKTRSRLDFFIVSATLISEKYKVENLPGRLCKLFDHKSVKLVFAPDPDSSGRHKSSVVKNSSLSKQCLSLSVHLEAKKNTAKYFK
jgi:exonuclease III